MASNPRGRMGGRRLRSLLLVTVIAAGSLAVAPGPVSAGIPGCALGAQKPGGTGTKAFGRFTFWCYVYGIPFQYQVALWEEDAGADQRRSLTGWLDAVIPNPGSYLGKGPSVGCNTEAGKEELYTKVRVCMGTPGAYETSAWEKSATLTTRTCQ